MHSQLQQVAPRSHTAATSEARSKSQQSEWELVQTHRTKVTLTLSLAGVASEGAHSLLRASVREHQAYVIAAADLPMSILNFCLIFVEGSTDKAVRRRPRAWALRPPLNAHDLSCGRLSRRFRSRWCSWASSSAPSRASSK
jgi:hypothetical protein